MSMKRATWTEEDLAGALEAIEAGTTQRQAAQMFNVSRTTLRNHVKSKVKTKHLGSNQILTVEQEKEVCSRILRYSEIGMPVTASIVKTCF